MKKKIKKGNEPQQNVKNRINDDPVGYPQYPEGEDIYGKFQKDRKIDPEDPTSLKDMFDNYRSGKFNMKDFDDDVTGGDLDIPGSELDDYMELAGNEDEENNYYSLGGDDHHDLEEDFQDLE
jgi:hypothetical protein